MGKKVLILSASAGAGHIRAAQAIEEAFKVHFNNLEVTNVDVLEYSPSIFRKSYVCTYLSLAGKRPSLYGYLYNITNNPKVSRFLDIIRIFLDKLNTKKLKSFVKKYKPDVVICTHYLPAELLSLYKAKGIFNNPVCVCVTDFDVHNYWSYNNLEHYYVASEEVKFHILQKGFPEDRIFVTGIPVFSHFNQKLNKEEIMRKLNLRPNILTLLMCSGGYGMGRMGRMVESVKRIANIEKEMQLLVITGKNSKLLENLKLIIPSKAVNYRLFGFVDNMNEFMEVSDFIITKAGGLTLSECLCKNLPMILMNPIPGQEEKNADYFLECGVALQSLSPESLEFKTRYLIEHPEKLEDMKKKTQLMAKPNAAMEIVEKCGRFLK